jgi:hypothetical protein
LKNFPRPLFTIGVHTVDHPYLTRCTLEESIRQMRDIGWERRQKRRAEPYPMGDYNENTLQHCHALGMTHGYAVVPDLNNDATFEVPRIGIHSPSMKILGFKVMWGGALVYCRGCARACCS